MSERPVPGDVWRDCDRRMSDRYVFVLRVDDEYAYVVKCNSKGHVSSQRQTRLRINRMKPSSTGFTFVRKTLKQSEVKP